VAEADSVDTALSAIREFNPDLLFLDVEMPKGNGFDLLEQMEEVNFETIFVTAFDHYAIQALNYSAAYYLLKPVSIDELIAAVDKIKRHKQESNQNIQTKVLIENFQSKLSNQKKLVLPLMEGFEVVKIAKPMTILRIFTLFLNLK